MVKRINFVAMELMRLMNMLQNKYWIGATTYRAESVPGDDEN